MRKSLTFNDLLDGIKEETLDLLSDSIVETDEEIPLAVVPPHLEQTGEFVVENPDNAVALADGGDDLVLEPTTLTQAIPSQTPTSFPDEPSEMVRRLVGILFCTPDHPLGQSEIIPNLDHFHIVSGDWMTIYLPGYGADWPEKIHGDRQNLTVLGGETWQFSTSAFTMFCQDIQRHANWQYGNKSELILADGVYRGDTGERKLDCSRTLQFNLEAVIQNRHIRSVHGLLDRLLGFCNGHAEPDMDDDGIIQLIRSDIMAWFLEQLPDPFKPDSGPAPFCIRNMEKQ